MNLAQSGADVITLHQRRHAVGQIVRRDLAPILAPGCGTGPALADDHMLGHGRHIVTQAMLNPGVEQGAQLLAGLFIFQPGLGINQHQGAHHFWMNQRTAQRQKSAL